MTDEIQDIEVTIPEVPPKQPASAVAVPTGAMELTEQSVEQFEKAIELYKRARIAALRMTTVNDWIDYGGAPYLQETGAEPLAAPFGISFSNLSRERSTEQDNEGPYEVFYTYADAHSEKLHRSLPGVIGSCTTRQKLHGWKGRANAEIPNIKKHSYSNMVRNAVVKILGIGGITWDELTEFGIKRDQVKKVEFKEGKEKAAAEEKKATEEGKGVDDARKQIWSDLLLLAGGEEALAIELLSLSTTSEKDGRVYKGRKSINDLTEKQVFWYKTNRLKKLQEAADEGVVESEDLKDYAWKLTGVGGERKGAPV